MKTIFAFLSVMSILFLGKDFASIDTNLSWIISGPSGVSGLATPELLLGTSAWARFPHWQDIDALRATPTTWYIRPDGGTRSQCTGKEDFPFSGSGHHQPCAFSNPYYLFTDDVSPTFSWIVNGGDTVIIKNGSYRMGYKGPTPQNFWAGCRGNPFDCYMPPIPSGTETRHTRIVGENLANCTSKPELYGGFGLEITINLENSSNVDLQCLNITDHGPCGKQGDSNICRSDFPLDDFAVNGIVTNNSTKNILLQDLDIHGFAARGIMGGFGGSIQATRVSIRGNTAAGWDFDDGRKTQSTGTLRMSFVTIEWNGCSEVYPPTYPPSYDHCFDDNKAGYGDGVGTPDTGGTFLVDHSVFRYNTQDGLDLLHVGEIAPAIISVTNSMAYGNMGNQFKLGPSNATTFVNNVAIGNCFRLRGAVPGRPRGAFPPNPSRFNEELTDYCRAAGDAVVVEVADTKPAVIQNNSFTAQFNIALDLICPGGFSCGKLTSVQLDNNLFLGFPDLSGGHRFITAVNQQGGANNFLTNPPSSFKHNLLFRTSDVCPAMGAVGEICVKDPLLASEANIDTVDFHLKASSPARSTGMILPSVTTDIAGTPRPKNAPYDVGAYQFVP